MSLIATMPKQKYENLEEKAKAYDDLLKAISRGGFFEIPSVRKSKEIIKAFRTTKLYNKKFLDSFSRGLKRSSFFV